MTSSHRARVRGAQHGLRRCLDRRGRQPTASQVGSDAVADLAADPATVELGFDAARVSVRLRSNDQD